MKSQRLDFTAVKQQAQGNWRAILTALGIPAESLTDKHQPCPACGGKDRFRFDDRHGNGGFICNHMDGLSGDGFTLLMHVYGYTYPEAVRAVAGVLGIDKAEPYRAAPLPPTAPAEPPQDRSDKLAAVWHAAQELQHGDPVTQYLAGRGLDMGSELPQSIRYHAALPYWVQCSDGWQETGRYPAMIAAITEADGTLAGLHTTYLKPCYTPPAGDNAAHALSHTKLNAHHPETGALLPAKKMQTRFSGIGWLTGKAVRLYQPHHGELLVCEGIETALAARELTGWPCYAALSANGMAAFQWPENLQTLLVCADHDTAGLAAAEKLARRAKLAGLNVYTMTPPNPDTDALDLLNARKAAEQAGGIDD
ncbi:toprim domain-containing protein [Neisseria sp. ZJ106]|uniref:Toprim domain-containing protein n=1 Tax=Neisseria lisongii TaxID=2912188 RepID=A0ABY7RJ08_9NEIS|nr:toprim domain-containing protein [Neisseria lisongii]MCF7520445.1 toprim domain-containing protein [Neisseria lisongii]WCL71612.1 toprim domain-containing protein [Neisseria lisongii]